MDAKFFKLLVQINAIAVVVVAITQGVIAAMEKNPVNPVQSRAKDDDTITLQH